MSCLDGRRYYDLDVIRAAVTRLTLTRELTGRPVSALASKAGLNRSTVSRMLNGRLVGISTLLSVLAVLGLTFEDVGMNRPSPADEQTGT